ncbi:MAG: hypothetical protein WD266_07200 [Balneolales bacterium]
MIYLTYGLLTTSFFIVFLEILLQIQGHRPWHSPVKNMKIEPENDFFSQDPVLGLKHNPGTFRVVISGTHSFSITHDEDALRITRPVCSNRNGSLIPKEEIWVYGCSFTHGWSLNDDETYPWHLQMKLPDFRVCNFGMSGYSTLQSLIQFRKALETKKKPKYVIVSYSCLHDKRNIFLRSWKKIIEPDKTVDDVEYPCGKIDMDGNLNYASTSLAYKPFPVMNHSALMHYLEKRFNSMQEKYHKSHIVTRLVMEEFLKTCDQNGIKLLVAGLDDSAMTTNMLRYCKREGISVAGIPVDLTDPENINVPHTYYPNARANKKYAERIAACIIINEKKIQKKKNRQLRMQATGMS